MRPGLLFTTVLAACSGGAPATPPRQLAPRPTWLDVPAVPSTLAGPVSPGTRGAACSLDRPCGEDLWCLPLAGGVCTSSCGVTGGACDGACIETPRNGELCMASCAGSSDCRVDEGYVCDRTWRACVLPNLASIVPRRCPASRGTAPDPAFGPSTVLSTAASPGIYQFVPSAATTAQGGLVAMYGTRSGPREGSLLGLARLDARGRTTLDTPFGTARAHHFDPWLARDARGTLHATWLGFDAPDTGQEIAFATSRDGGKTWSGPVAVHDPVDCLDKRESCVDKPMVVVGRDPAKLGAQVVYVLYGAHGLRVRASRDGGRSFGPAATALSGTYGNATVGADGRLHVVTIAGGHGGGFGTGDHRIEYTVSRDAGRTFTAPITVSRRDETLPFFFSNPSIAVDARRGWTYVAYVRGGRDAVWDLVIAASRDGGLTWSRTRIGDDPACAIHMVPNLALDAVTGTLHITWYDSRGTSPGYAHASCGPGGVRCTQPGRINDVPFARLSTVRHAAHGVGEYQSLVIDERRRVLHAVWTQPVDDGGKIISRIFHARAKLR